LRLAAAIAPRILLGLLALWLGLWPAADGATGASRGLATPLPGAATETTPASPAATTAASAPDAPAAASSACGGCCCDRTAPSAGPADADVARAAPGATDAATPPTDHPAGCCPTPDPAAPAVPSCPAGKTARCVSCCGAGGMVLFATATVSLEADHAVVGTLGPCCERGDSRHLQPPVPPPWPVA
jgi:hypothetical protein